MDAPRVYHTQTVVDEQGQVHLRVPENMPPGSRVTVEVRAEAAPPAPIRKPVDQMTDEEIEAELAEPLTFRGGTGADAVATGTFGAWADVGTKDSVAFIEELRRKEARDRGLLP